MKRNFIMLMLMIWSLDKKCVLEVRALELNEKFSL